MTSRFIVTAAQSKGDITLGIGVGNVNPQGGNSSTAAGLIRAGTNTRPTLRFEYFAADKIPDMIIAKLLAAWPLEHAISLAGAGRSGSAGAVACRADMRHRAEAVDIVDPARTPRRRAGHDQP